jgi:hypothetical protein
VLPDKNLDYPQGQYDERQSQWLQVQGMVSVLRSLHSVSSSAFDTILRGRGGITHKLAGNALAAARTTPAMSPPSAQVTSCLSKDSTDRDNCSCLQCNSPQPPSGWLRGSRRRHLIVAHFCDCELDL